MKGFIAMEKNIITLPNGVTLNGANNSAIYSGIDREKATEDFIKKNLLELKGSAVVMTDNNKLMGEAEALMQSGKDVNILFIDMVMAGKGYRPLRHALTCQEDVKKFVETLLNATYLSDHYRIRAEYLLYALLYMMKDNIEEPDLTFATLNSLIESSISDKKELNSLFENCAGNDQSGFSAYYKAYQLTSNSGADSSIFIALQRELMPFIRMENPENVTTPEQVDFNVLTEKPSVLFVVYNKEKDHGLAKTLVLNDILKTIDRKDTINVPVTLFVDDDDFDVEACPDIYDIVGKGVDIEWVRTHPTEDYIPLFTYEYNEDEPEDIPEAAVQKETPASQAPAPVVKEEVKPTASAPVPTPAPVTEPAPAPVQTPVAEAVNTASAPAVTPPPAPAPTEPAPAPAEEPPRRSGFAFKTTNSSSGNAPNAGVGQKISFKNFKLKPGQNTQESPAPAPAVPTPPPAPAPTVAPPKPSNSSTSDQDTEKAYNAGNGKDWLFD